MPQSIFHLEPTAQFIHRAVELNRLYNPEDPIHDAILTPRDGVLVTAVKDDDESALCRKKLAAIHRDFPYGAPIHEQAAYLVRGFNGLAPFAEGNHRTGWDYLAELLTHQDRHLQASQDDGRALGNDLWNRMQSAYPNGFDRRNVLDRDEVFAYLAEWFRPRIA